MWATSAAICLRASDRVNLMHAGVIERLRVTRGGYFSVVNLDDIVFRSRSVTFG